MLTASKVAIEFDGFIKQIFRIRIEFRIQCTNKPMQRLSNLIGNTHLVPRSTMFCLFNLFASQRETIKILTDICLAAHVSGTLHS